MHGDQQILGFITILLANIDLFARGGKLFEPTETSGMSDGASAASE